MANALRGFLLRYTVFELMIVAVLASLGVAVSEVVGYLVRIVTSLLFIPGGAVAGGIYMLFPVLSVAFTGKKSAALLCGFVQAIIVMVSGIGGNHGALTIVTYTMPGVAVLLLLLALRKDCGCRFSCFFSCMAANVTGTMLVAWGVMGLPLVPMLLAMSVSALSGGLGGLLAHSLAQQVRKTGVIGGSA